MAIISGIGGNLKCLIFDPFCGATEAMILGALLGCGADEWRVRSAVEGLCDAPLDIVDGMNGRMASKIVTINESEAKKRYGDLTKDEALAKLNVMHENQPVRVDAMKIVGNMLDARQSLYGPGANIDIYTLALIAGICSAYDALKRPLVQATPVATGGGIIDSSTGKVPVPRPEIVELFKKSKLIAQGGPFDGELLSLGAAATLAYYVQSSSKYYPDFEPLAVGYGGGKLDLPMPNVLRATLCEEDEALIQDRMELLETNVDDVTGEVLGSLIEELMAMGAMDVSIIPATMKKGRTGQIIRAVVKAADGPAIARRIMLETGSLGVRVMPVRHRLIARREIVVISVGFKENFYDMRFKLAGDTGGKVIDLSVEYDDAKKVSRELGMPLKTVMRIAEAQAWEKYSGGQQAY
jgi:hypothetical protein